MGTVVFESMPSLTSYLSTELNSLANGGNKLGAAFDTTQALNIAVELSVAAQGSARSAGATVYVYLLKSLDAGSNYDYGSDSLDPSASCLLTQFSLDAATTARVLTAIVPLPGDLAYAKLLLKNSTGQAFAASGTTLKYCVFGITT